MVKSVGPLKVAKIPFPAPAFVFDASPDPASVVTTPVLITILRMRLLV